jgi:hypothetical protein
MATPSQKVPAASAARIEIDSIHSFLIHPGKGAENPHDINGASVPKSGKLFEMLRPVFDGAAEDCPHKIAFNSQEGQQKNDCRDALISYIKNCDLNHGRDIAKRLQAVTTRRSGLGLLFLMTGEKNGETKIVVSRFPADSGILAEEKGKGLSVEFLEDGGARRLPTQRLAWWNRTDIRTILGQRALHGSLDRWCRGWGGSQRFPSTARFEPRVVRSRQTI